jgi:competence protein ComEA
MRRFTYVLGILCLWLLAAPLAAQEKPAPVKAPAPTAATPLNLNTATAVQIATLPGIGPKAAQRIIEYRQKNNGFKKIEELMNVKGIGEKSFLKLKPLITVADKPASSRE